MKPLGSEGDVASWSYKDNVRTGEAIVLNAEPIRDHQGVQETSMRIKCILQQHKETS